MTTEKVWTILHENTQRVAEDNELVPPGQQFRLTDHQTQAISELGQRLAEGDKRILLKAPTGSGKTEVFMRVAVGQVLDKGKHAVILVPTRDLARQQSNYFEERLEDTGLEVAQMHAGIPPRTRRDALTDLERGDVHFLVGSAMLLQHSSKYRKYLESCAVLIVDDVNAFDEDEDLSKLVGLKCPIIFVTATPDAVARFLRREGALDNMVTIQQMPFDSPPTIVHEANANWSENIFSQMDRGMDQLLKHKEQGSRIYVISRTRARVPIMAKYIEDRLQVPVSILHGEMADSGEHKKRQRTRKGATMGNVSEDRVSMMKQFRENSPAVLVATNLVGSGLDIPMADMLLVTDADHFGVAEIEQLLGRVGRRERPSDAVLVRGTTASPVKGEVQVKGTTRIRNGRVIQTFRAVPRNRRGYNPRRVV